MILIALGANLPSRYGTPAETIAQAYAALETRGLKILKKSRLWLTAPVPVSDQPWFHNSVIEIDTILKPADLLLLLHKIEEEFGRVRVVRNEARILDLDLISYHDGIIVDPELQIPHPRLHERGFVLFPLQDIAPDWQHPVSNNSIADMIAALPDGQTARPE